jgi:hypothetical protein
MAARTISCPTLMLMKLPNYETVTVIYLQFRGSHLGLKIVTVIIIHDRLKGEKREIKELRII